MGFANHFLENYEVRMPMNLQFLLAQAIGQVGLMQEIWDLLSVMDLNINWLPKYGAKICPLTHSRHQMDDCAPDFNFAVCSAGAAQEFPPLRGFLCLVEDLGSGL